MNKKEFNSVINAIVEGALKVPVVNLENKIDSSSEFKGEANEEKLLEAENLDFVYDVIATKNGWREREETDSNPEEWYYEEAEVNVELTGVTDKDGNEIELTGDQKEKLELLIKAKTEVEY